ncbi:MAG: hypothetical protein JRJ29_19075 [Deltaproteobacteria bacterium]|nr:hypothetical protein [Deltaproteobacteria bacterium]
MLTKKGSSMIALGVALLLLSACVSAGPGERARVVAQSGKTGNKVTIQQLQENWQDYFIHYSGVKITQPVGILFDPKGDGKTIKVGSWWGKVEDRKRLRTAVEWMNARSSASFPQVSLILGPNEQVFGYVYTYNPVPVRTRVISDTEIFVYDLSL